MRAQRRTDRERRPREFATRQFGVLDDADLVNEGLTRNEIAGRLRMSSLTRVHHRVYAFRHTALRAEGRWLAALWDDLHFGEARRTVDRVRRMRRAHDV